MKQLHFLKSLYDDYKEELFRFALRKVGCSDDAEDIVQDTFHNMLGIDNLHNFENPRAYLYRTANNLALNKHRQQNRQTSAFHQLSHQEHHAPDTAHQIFAQSELEDIATALQELPETTQAIFHLSRVENKTYSQISEQLNLSTSSVEKHMMKTLKKIRQAVEVN